jgi:hypothetical protein
VKVKRVMTWRIVSECVKSVVVLNNRPPVSKNEAKCTHPPLLQFSNSISRPVALMATAQRFMSSLPPPASNFTPSNPSAATSSASFLYDAKLPVLAAAPLMLPSEVQWCHPGSRSCSTTHRAHTDTRVSALRAVHTCVHACMRVCVCVCVRASVRGLCLVCPL